MVDTERAIKLLGSGIGPAAVATTLGCDPSYISQLLMQDEYRDRVLALRMESLHQQTARDKKIDALEDAVLEKLENLLPYITNVKQALTAFQLLNAAKRRGAAVSGDINLTQNVVQINLPPVAREFFFPKMNAQGEVVQVGEQITVTKSLQTLMQERMHAKLQERKTSAHDVQEIKNEAQPASERSGERNSTEREQAAA
jgi:hypothetical protein